MNFESVRSIIDTYIKKNGVEAITGDILNNVLNTMLDDVDNAISSIEPSPGGGSGEGGVSEKDVLNILEKNDYITSSALSSYYTKTESDNRYLASSLLGSNTLIHSGNIGSYKAGGALKLVGDNNTICDYSVGVSTMSFFTDWGLTNTLGSYLYGMLMESPDASYKVQVGHALWKGLYWRDMDAGTWTSWKKIVTENADGNVGIGTISPQYKLDVNGDISAMSALRIGGCGTSYCGLYPNSQITSSGNATRLWLYSEQGLAIYGSTIEMISAVTISSTLRVNSIIYSDVDIRMGSSSVRDISIGVTNSYGTYYLGNDSNGGYIYSGGYIIQWNLSSRNVTIGSNLIVSGDFSFGSDMRFKDKIEDIGISIADIAKAPLFTYKWNDRKDDIIYLGSSAQYWEKIAPWLVSGDDFKSLNYATLGVAMGISLAKKTINHEERIKALEKEIKRLKEEQYGN